MSPEESFWKHCFFYALKRCKDRDLAEDFAQESWIYCYRNMWRPSVPHFWRHFCRENLKRAGSYSTKSWRLWKRRGDFQSPEGEYLDYLEHKVPSQEPEAWGCFLMKSLSSRHKIILFLLEAGWTRADLSRAFPELDISEILQNIQTSLADDPEFAVVLGPNREIPVPLEVQYRRDFEKGLRVSDLASLEI